MLARGLVRGALASLPGMGLARDMVERGVGLGTSMADLKKMTVRTLRELARKHLGPGYTRLKTKSDLVAALTKAMPKAVREALEETPEGELPAPAAAAGPEGSATEPPDEAATSPAPPAKPETAAAPARPAPKVEPPQPKPEAPPSIPAATAAEAAQQAEAPAEVPAKAAAPAEPAPAGAFVEFDEQLGELPESYGEDSVVALPKDPQVLYVYWDFSRDSLRRATEWLPGAKARLRLFADNKLVKEVDASIDAKSWYFYGLNPGRSYRVEVLCVGEDGQERRVGPASNPMRLPPLGPSPILEDRFVRVALDVPAGRVAEAVRQAGESRPVAPPFVPEIREKLYEMSGGTARALSSPEPGQLGATGGADEDDRSAAPAGVRSSGTWPWSGDVPRRSGR